MAAAPRPSAIAPSVSQFGMRLSLISPKQAKARMNGSAIQTIGIRKSEA